MNRIEQNDQYFGLKFCEIPDQVTDVFEIFHCFFRKNDSGFVLQDFIFDFSETIWTEEMRVSVGLVNWSFRSHSFGFFFFCEFSDGEVLIGFGLITKLG